MRRIPLAAFALLSLGPLVRGQLIAIEEQALLSSDLAPYDRMGTEVALDGDRLAVTVPGEEEATYDWFDAGAVYVFERGAAGWSQTAKVKPMPQRGREFGASLALEGDTLVVGAPNEFVADVLTGAVYVYRHNGTGWQQEALLAPGVPNHNQRFGEVLALDGDTLAVGVPGDGEIDLAAGAAEIFVRTGTTWTLQAKLTASDADRTEWFGDFLSLSGDTAVVGKRSAGLYVFERAGSSWTETARIANGAYPNFFGKPVLTDGRRIFARHHVGGSSDTVRVFKRLGSGWVLATILGPTNPIGLHRFGRDMALDGPYLAVSSAGDTLDAAQPGAGTVHLFVEDGDGWAFVRKFGAAGGLAWDGFGSAMDLSRGRIAAGAPLRETICQSWEPSCESGGAWVFTVEDSATSFCSSPTELSSCPCGAGASGAGCAVNPTAAGVRLDVAVVQTGPVPRARFVGSGYPATGTPASIVIRAPVLESFPVVFGTGLRCVGPAYTRLTAAFAIGGATNHEVGHAAGPGTFHYQLWYRSPVLPSCNQPGFNLSNGRSVAW